MFKPLTLLFVSSLLLASPELIQGKLASKKQFLSTVQISSVCTATKISEYLFITAAHCIVNSNNELRKTYTTNLNLNTHFAETYNVKIESIRIHPSYTTELKKRIKYGLYTSGVSLSSYDVGVIRVNSKTPKIKIAKLYFEFIDLKKNVYILGFGCEKSTKEKREGKGRLKYNLNRTVGYNKITKNIHELDAKKAFVFNIFTNGNQFDRSSASLCHGDSGGGLFLKETQSLIGINSYFLFKDNKGVSAINTHTRISELKDWIKSLLHLDKSLENTLKDL